MVCHAHCAEYHYFEYSVLNILRAIDSDNGKSPALAAEFVLFVNLLQQEQNFMNTAHIYMNFFSCFTHPEYT